MKIIASLIILGLCANFCYAAVTTTSQASAMSTSWLSNTPTKVYSAANETDAAIWNQRALASPPTGAAAVGESEVIFGPGTSNDTAYVYGFIIDDFKISQIYKRTLNATIVSWGNDTNMASVVKDDSISSTTPAEYYRTAVGPGYLAILSIGTDGTSTKQAYLNLVSGTTATEYKLTSVSDIACTTGASTTTDLKIGNIWYDKESGAFFYTYSKSVTSKTCTSGSTVAGSETVANTIYLGGHYANGTAYWAAPGLSLTPVAADHSIGSLTAGGDNWLNATNIYVVYKDTSSSSNTIYFTKLSKKTTTTSAETFTALVTDDATTGATKDYIPLSVWASAHTFGIAVYCMTQTGTSTYEPVLWNYLNGNTTAITHSGLSYTEVTGEGGMFSLSGWMLNTGYTLVGSWGTPTTATDSVLIHKIGTFFANGTANQTGSTLASIRGPVSYYEDGNGTMWVGWTDVDTGNSATYAGYLAILQNQINAGANTLSTVLAFVALFLASIFAF